MNATPIIWCVYVGTDGKHHAIIKEDFETMSKYIWPPDCPILHVPIADGERLKYAALPEGQFPKCWHEETESRQHSVDATTPGFRGD